MKPTAVPEPTAVGHYSGPFSRLAAYAADALVVAAVFSGTSALILWIVQLVTARDVQATDLGTVPSAILFGTWYLVYFWLSWAVAGRTVGMAVFGLRVVRRDGSDLPPSRAAVRAITFPLSFAPLGLGFVGIVVGRERRALHDVLAGTTVVYDWDARAVRLRARSRPRASTPAPQG